MIAESPTPDERLDGGATHHPDWVVKEVGNGLLQMNVLALLPVGEMAQRRFAVHRIGVRIRERTNVGFRDDLAHGRTFLRACRTESTTRAIASSGGLSLSATIFGSI